MLNKAMTMAILSLTSTLARPLRASTPVEDPPGSIHLSCEGRNYVFALEDPGLANAGIWVAEKSDPSGNNEWEELVVLAKTRGECPLCWDIEAEWTQTSPYQMSIPTLTLKLQTRSQMDTSQPGASLEVPRLTWFLLDLRGIYRQMEDVECVSMRRDSADRT